MASIADDDLPARRRGEDLLDADQRALTRACRDAARIVGAAALPAEYRGLAFVRVLELELEHAIA